MTTSSSTTPHPARVPTLCTVCGRVRDVSSRYNGWNTWGRLRCESCGTVTLHGRADRHPERYGKYENHAREACQEARQLMIELTSREDLDFRWTHVEVLDETPLEWASRNFERAWENPAQWHQAVVLQQMRDGSRTWYLLKVDARMDPPDYVGKLRFAAAAIQDPDRYFGRWRPADNAGGEWRGIYCKVG